MAIVAALVGGGPAAGARVKLAGGATTLKLARGTAAVLEANGVSVRPLHPARPRRGAIAFPITGGAINPASARGRIDHSGGLAFRAGHTRGALRSFRVHVGTRRATLTAAAAQALNQAFSTGAFTEGRRSAPRRCRRGSAEPSDPDPTALGPRRGPSAVRRRTARD